MSPALTSQGPLSSAYSVPARPRPGRKTALDEPASKRKAQNRQAQRAFRQRKQEQAISLEETNKQLSITLEQLESENKELRQLLDQSNQEYNVVVQASSEMDGRFTALQEQLRTEVEKNEKLLNAQKTIEAQARESATLRQHCQSLQSQVASLQHLRQPTLPDGTVRLHIKNKKPVRLAAALRAPLAIVHSPPVSTVGQQTGKAQKRPDGCGNCEETGDCPCVDIYVDAANIGRDSESPSNSARKQSAMSISSVLSPADEKRPWTGSHQTMPELSDASSVAEVETDFTNFFKPNVTGASGPGFPANKRPSAVLAAEKCGFCTDDSNCLCSEAMIGVDATTTANRSKAYSPLDRATPRYSAPVQPTIQPGTCPACQANPEQKAFCESLAVERAANRTTNSEDAGRSAKRPRLDTPNTVSIPCAEAFPLFQRLSRSGSNITYDVLYQELMQSQPSNRHEAQADEPNSVENKGRQYSAFEADIGEVLASLHRHGPRSSGAGLSGDASSGGGGGAVTSTSGESS